MGQYANTNTSYNFDDSVHANIPTQNTSTIQNVDTSKVSVGSFGSGVHFNGPVSTGGATFNTKVTNIPTQVNANIHLNPSLTTHTVQNLQAEDMQNFQPKISFADGVTANASGSNNQTFNLNGSNLGNISIGGNVSHSSAVSTGASVD